ncbi:hypothetical protein [Aquimarina algiphila]|uniref:hypothetical protein n=1 Tax=Aquimarina algiphila TaxID=2047982 RepID=UPI00249277BE|nr:hypothetical protein [Aquimarina algiphila]
MSTTKNNSIQEQINADLLESFTLFIDSEYTGYDPLKPVSKIIFSAQGEITSPPDLEFMGYGGGSEGESFSECGGIDLTSFFPLDEQSEYFASNEDEYIEECLQNASAAVLKGLQSVVGSIEFQKLPKDGPVVFVLNLIDQKSKVICRIHPDGDIELPPKKES